MSKKIFISGALTGIKNPDLVKADYEQVGLLCEKHGAVAYRPWCHTDPIAAPQFSANEVYETGEENDVDLF